MHIENCQEKASAKWYLGKRVAYVYKVKNAKKNTRYRCSWGKVINTHGAAGAVRVSFRRNITAHAQGAFVRVMLYPQRDQSSSGSLAGTGGSSGGAVAAAAPKVLLDSVCLDASQQAQLQ